MWIKKTIWLILLIFTAACAADRPGEMVPTVTLTPSTEPEVLTSSTPTHLPPTPSTAPTSSPSPTIPVATATQPPLERLAFTGATACGYYCDTMITFVNSDGTGMESPRLVEPFYNSRGYLAWSPNGRYLAFDGGDTVMGCENALGTDCSKINYGTFVADYSQSAILHHIEGTLTNASWSPDSQHLVLSLGGKTEGRRFIGDLYIFDVNSGRLRQLTSSPSSHLYPSWSPDGQWIAFLRFDPTVPGCGSFPSIYFENEKCNQASLYRIRPDGSDLQLLFEPVFIFNKSSWMGDISNAPTWSPDSRWLAFLTRNEKGFHDHSDISIVNVETGEWRLVVSRYDITISPAWSPDGQQLAFASDRDGGQFDIFLWDMKENSIVNLTETSTSEYAPVWSLSGAHIACNSDYDLLIMNADGTNGVLIDDEDLGGTRGIPAWQPGVWP